MDLTGFVRRLRASRPELQIAYARYDDEQDVVEVFTGIQGRRRKDKAAALNVLQCELPGRKIHLRSVIQELEPALIADHVKESIENGVSLTRILDNASRYPIRFGARACRIAISGTLGEHLQEQFADNLSETETMLDVNQPGLRYDRSEIVTENGKSACDVWILMAPSSPRESP